MLTCEASRTKFLVPALWALTLTVGALQMMKVRIGLVTTHGADVLAPALLYFLTRQGKSYLRFLGMPSDRPGRIAIGLMVLCVGWEVGQKFRVIPGVFDWWDLLAYAVGIGVAVWGDRKMGVEGGGTGGQTLSENTGQFRP